MADAGKSQPKVLLTLFKALGSDEKKWQHLPVSDAGLRAGELRDEEAGVVGLPGGGRGLGLAHGLDDLVAAGALHLAPLQLNLDREHDMSCC